MVCFPGSLRHGKPSVDRAHSSLLRTTFADGSRYGLLSYGFHGDTVWKQLKSRNGESSSDTTTYVARPKRFRTPDPQIRSLMLHSDERTYRSLQIWRRRPSGLYQANLPARGHARRPWQLVATRATPHVYHVPPRSFDRAQWFLNYHYR
jgi:hypothetical protein